LIKFDWSLLHKLEEKYGDSFYLLDLASFKNNYYKLLNAFRSIYPRTNIAYSYKTNYIPKLCQLVNSWGGYAEVVSGMEYELALKVGVSPEAIIFNGPYKTEENLRKAFLNGSIVNLDSMYEVSIVRKIDNELDQINGKIGLRCNFDIGEEKISRFGFDVESKEFVSLFKILQKLKNFKLVGLHCHYSTVHRSIESFTLRTQKMIQLALKYFGKDYPEFIDIGGGFFGEMPPDLKRQFNCYISDYNEYATAVATPFTNSFKGEKSPELILEPGTAITGDIMKFVAKVIDIKQIRSRKVALVSGNIYNIKPTLNDKNLPITIVSRDEKEPDEGPIDIVGNTCMEKDCLFSNYKGKIKKGDFILFDNVGAYTVVLKPSFIHFSPFILTYDEDSKNFEIIKNKETFSDIFSTYEF
jgi:diaminopimelate decarboxylase